MSNSPPSLSSLLIQETQAQIYAAALQIAQTLGLVTTAWDPGDPTRSLFYLESNVLAALEQIVVGYIQSGFLDYASGVWLQVLAYEQFGVTVPPATYATTSVTLTNSGGGIYEFDPGDITFLNSTTNQTYHNTTGGTLNGSGSTLSVTVVADQAGSVSSASAGEIDTLVTTFLGVTCTNPTAAVGTDTWSDATIRAQCRASLGSLSPNGPASAYSYVALNSNLTGQTGVTRCNVYPDSTTGDVTIYIAGPSGSVDSGVVSALQSAIQMYATPLCITPTVVSATAVTINVTYTIWVYQSVNQDSTAIEAAIQTALENAFANEAIGGDIIPPASTGYVYQSLLQDTIGETFPEIFRVTISSPSGDTPLTNGQVPVLGTVTPTINFVPNRT
jgi:uncharacterized phage protein gp47/JayE